MNDPHTNAAALAAAAAPLGEDAALASRHRAIFHSAIDFAIVGTDIEGRVTDWNAGAAGIFGWTADEMVGQPAARFFTPEDRADGRVETEMRLALADGRADDERWHLRKDGSRFWASGELMLLKDDDGAHIGYVKIVRDRTAARAAAAAQAAEAAFLRSVLASSSDCIKVLDLDGNLVFMSEGGQRVMEVDDFAAVRGCAWPDFWPPAGSAAARDAIAAARAGGVGHFSGPANTVAGNPRWWDVRVTPILGDDGKPVSLLSISRDVSATKAAEEALRRAEDFNASILDSSMDCTVVLDADANTLFVSRGGIAAMEIENLDNVIGKWWPRVWKGADHAAACNAVAAALAGGSGHFEGYCPTHRGTPKWWDVVITPLPATDGQQRRLVSVGRDITARRQAEAQLARSEERLNLALGATSFVGIWDWNLRTGLIHADANFARVYSVDPAWAARGAPLAEYLRNLHPDDLPRFEAELERLFAGAAEFACEYRVLQPDGASRWLLASGRLVAGDDGQPARFPGATVDITRRKEAELALQHLNETLEQRVAERTRERDRSWKLSSDLQVVCDSSGTFISVNAAVTAILGWPPEQFVGRSSLEFIHPDDVDATRAALAHAVSAVLPSFENRYRHIDGGLRWISWVAAPDNGLIYASGRHVTAEKEAAAALAQVQDQLRQSQKMEAIGQLTGGIAHDFNNMLAAILGSVELARRRVAAGRLDVVDGLLETATGSIRRAGALTQRLLAFARQQPLKIETVDVAALLRSTHDIFVRTIGQSIALQIVTAPQLWCARIDAAQLESVLLNLVLNARDAMPDGGSLTIEAGNGRLDAGYAATHTEVSAGDYVVVSVSDSGVGMAADVLSRAFEPFFTTKPLGQGTGLGLSMIFGFMKQAGGHVRLHSTPGSGTAVTLYLPRADDDDAAAPADAIDTQYEATGETILLAEDDPDLRELQATILEDLGYRPIVVEDARAALQVLETGRPIDLLLTDVGLPGMNGRQLADIARRLRPELPILFLTGYAERAATRNDFLAPNMQMLTKPVDLEVLAAKLRQIFGR